MLFRELLIEGNELMFLVEGSDTDRVEAVAGVESSILHLRQLHQHDKAAPLFKAVVDKKLKENGHGAATFGSDSHGILQGYFVRARLESQRVLKAKLAIIG